MSTTSPRNPEAPATFVGSRRAEHDVPHRVRLPALHGEVLDGLCLRRGPP